MPLYGHEMDEDISPLEAGLGLGVKLTKDEFIGRDAILAAGEPTRVRVGLKAKGRGNRVGNLPARTRLFALAANKAIGERDRIHAIFPYRHGLDERVGLSKRVVNGTAASWKIARERVIDIGDIGIHMRPDELLCGISRE